MYDVTIIGAGISGTSIARELSRYTLKVLLLEKGLDVAVGATKANSAIVHGGYAESHSKLKGRLCYQGRKQFAQLSQQLNFLFKPIGSLVLAFEKQQKEELEQLLENGQKNGLSDLRILKKDEIIAMEPNVNPAVEYALYCEGAGICSPYEMAIALAENAVHNGVRLVLNCEVTGIEKEGETFSLQTSQGKFASRFVVNAAGLAAAEVSALVGVNDFSIRPRSGEYLLLSRGTGSLVNMVLFQMPTKMGKGILVTPTCYENLLLGPDALDEQSDDRNTHPKRLYHIYQQALHTTDKIDITKFLRSFAGVRPVADTDDFIIEESRVKGFVNVAGIQSPGITSSPAVASLVRDILQSAGLTLQENPHFEPNRAPIHTQHNFVQGPELQQKLAIPVGQPGRFVCRCEQVLETEVTAAVSSLVPAATVDGVKRRTRAGMGWCQGEFCRPRVALAAEKLSGARLDTRTDVQRDGLSRVDRATMLEYIKNRQEK